MSAYAPNPETQTVGEEKKREFLSFSSYWLFVIFGIQNRTEIRRDCVGSPVFGVFPVKAESRYRKNRQIPPKSRERRAILTGGFRKRSAGTQARASWASAPDLQKPDIAAGFPDQVRKPVRVSWAPAGLLTFVGIGAGERARVPALIGAAGVELRSDRERIRRSVERTRGRAIGFPLRLIGAGLASWGGAWRNAFERPAAVRRDLGRRGRGW